MATVLAALLLLVASTTASMAREGLQGFNDSQHVVTPPGGTTAQTLATLSADLTDVRAFIGSTGATCGTNIEGAINAAVSAGYTNLLLPANCKYTPTTNTTPAAVQITGQDWNTSIISVVNRATDNLSMGARAVFRNVGIISTFCDTTADPVSTQKVCPVGYAQNVSDSAAAITNWVYEGVFLVSGASVTGPTGVVSTDTPNLSTVTSGAGTDAIYSQTGAAGVGGSGASGVRIVTAGSGDRGLYILNGFGVASSLQHTGALTKEFSNVSANNIASVRIDRAGDGADVTRSLAIDDVDATGSTYTRPFIDLVVGHQSAGQILNIFQGTTASTATVIQANMGNASGTYTGNFTDFQIAGTSVFKVNSSGQLTTTGDLITMSGTSPALVMTGTSSDWKLETTSNQSAWHNTTNAAEAIRMNHSSGAIQLQTNTADQLVINSSGGIQIGPSTLTLAQSELGLKRISASGSAPGALGGKIALVCGTNAGTAKLITYAGTSTTPVTIVDNIGGGLTGC